MPFILSLVPQNKCFIDEGDDIHFLSFLKYPETNAIMKKTTMNLFFILFLSFFSVTVKGQSPSSYEQLMEKMLVVTNSTATYQAGITQMITMFKQQSPNAPGEFWVSIEEELTKNILNDMTVMLTPIYKKYLTAEDLSQLIAFYDSPIGKKLSTVNPQIVSESMAAGQQWGMSLRPKIQEQMKAKGY